MKIRMKTQIVGARNGVRWPPSGSEIELPEREAAKLCAAGLAEPVAEPEPVETAIPPKAEEREDDKPRRGRPAGSKNRPKLAEEVSDGD